MAESIAIEELVQGVDELLSLPDVVSRANELIESETADAEDIAEVIGYDPALSAQLLKLVNSAFYSMPFKINTISRAITLIGINELRSLIFSASAVSVFNRIAPDTIDMDDFWFRSVYVGLAAKFIFGNPRKAEVLFLTGLLHDVGKIVLFKKADLLANQVLQDARRSGRYLYQVEEEILGFSSAEVGGYLLKEWGLGQNICNPIQYMHHPVNAGEYVREARILQLAARLADCAEPELKNQDMEKLEAVQKETELLESLAMQPEELRDVMEAVNIDSFEVLSIINPDSILVF